MRRSTRTSTDIFDGGGSSSGPSLVEQTTDMITRFRDSLIRSRKERLLDEDIQATDNLLNQIHLTELFAKDTLGKLMEQGNSMQRSYTLMNQLQKEIKEIAEDLNEVHGGKCCGLYSNGTILGFSCFGCLKKRKKRKKQKVFPKPHQHIHSTNKTVALGQSIPNPSLSNEIRWSSATERDDLLRRIRHLAGERRENPDFVQKMKTLINTKDHQKESNEKKINQYRDYLLEHHPFLYGYIDQPDRLINEIDMAIQFHQVDSHLDHLFQLTQSMNNELNKHNLIINKIGQQAMESGDLLTDYTLFGNQILGSSPTSPTSNVSTPSNLADLGMSTGQKMILNSVL